MAEEIGSPQWIEENNATLSRLEGVDGGDSSNFRLGIELKSSGESVFFVLNVDEHGATLEPGCNNQPGVSIIVDRQVARLINQGITSVTEAISNGEIKIKGKFDDLVKAGDLLSRFAKSLGTILPKQR